MTLTPERAAEIEREQRELNETAVRKHAQEAPMNLRMRFGVGGLSPGVAQRSNLENPAGARDYSPLQPIPDSVARFRSA